MEQTITLVIGEITPAEWYALHDKQPYPGQRYRTWLEDSTYVLEASRQPFCPSKVAINRPRKSTGR